MRAAPDPLPTLPETADALRTLLLAAWAERDSVVSERLDVIPAQFRVLVTRRPKLACRACEGVVVQAPASARLIEGGLPTEAPPAASRRLLRRRIGRRPMVAHVLVARYADHLPLYRQAGMMARPVSFADITPWDRFAMAWSWTAPRWRSGWGMPQPRWHP